jgi:hypothetical protein
MAINFKISGKFYPATDAGLFTFSNVPARSYKTTQVTFDRSFNHTPHVIAAIVGDIPVGYTSLSCAPYNVTPTGFTLKVINNTDSEVNPPVRWIAVMA